MALFVASLNSGSNGNCYYIGNNEDAILIDAGISCRETEKRMQRMGLAPQKIRAIFVSHEHVDHISGIPGLSKKYNIPVYITPDTLANSNLRLDDDLVFAFEAYKPVNMGNLCISAFPKIHDAAHAHSFVISCEGITVGVFTDIGIACEHLIKHFSQCHAAFLEANYDEIMLEKGSYPHHLKRRIRGGWGHLSNSQALEVFTTYGPSFMSHLFLSHLSKNNNNPQLVQDLFSQHAKGTEISVASRDCESNVYRIDATHSSTEVRISVPVKIPAQYSLF